MGRASTWVLRRAEALRRGATAGGDGRAGTAAPPAGWLWPRWLERQGDPSSPAFVPAVPGRAPENLTGRSWTAIGDLDSPHAALVDPCGLVAPRPGGWSLDWWVRGVDRWHVPARARGTAVTQRLLDAAPVVETSLRVPGGHAVHRAWCARHGGAEWAVVEVENRSRQPVAVALAVRPARPDGLGRVERIGFAGGVLAVDGRPALVLGRTPSRFAASTLAGGDSAEAVLADGGEAAWPGEVRCPAGLAQAAVVLPLAHTATLRVALPLDDAARRAVAAGGVDPAALPGADRVATGWRSQVQPSGALRVELPDPRLAEAVAACRAALLLRHHGEDLLADSATGEPAGFGDAAVLVRALDRWGHHARTAEALAALPARQRVDGSFRAAGEQDATADALWALAEHWRLTRDAALAEAAVGAAVRGAGRLARSSGPAGDGAAGEGYAARLRGVAGLHAAADLLDGAGQHDGATDCRRLAGKVLAAVEDDLAADADRLGSPAVPPAPGGRPGAASLPVLAAWAPLGLLSPGERLDATVEAVREGAFGVAGVPAAFDVEARRGYLPAATLRVGAAELAAGDRRALDRLAWALDVATPTWTWADALHPAGTGGTAGDGHSALVAAALLDLVRDLLVREVGDPASPGLALASLWPDEWLGQGLEVHDAPTRWGRLSYAVRWHGTRPALLWELAPHDGVPPVRLTVPGLDPSWSSEEPSGEALLAPVEPAGGLPGVLGSLPTPGIPASDAPEGGTFS